MRRALRLLAGVLIALAALAVLLGGALMLSANIDAGRRLIEQATRGLTHGEVQLAGLAGRFPDHLRLGRLTLRDPQGQWLEAEDLALDCSPLQLLERRAHIERLAAARVAVLRAPAYASHTKHRREGTDWSLPVRLELDTLEVMRLELAASLAGNAVAVRVQGAGRYRSLGQLSLQLQAQRLDQVLATYRGSATIDAQRVEARLDLDEGAGGPMANLAGLPTLGALAVHLQLSGSPDALVTDLAARAGALQAQASGTLDLPDRSGSLDLALDSAAMSPRAGLSWRRISLRARARGAFTAPATSAHLELVDLKADQLQLDSVRADLRGEGRGLALEASLAGLTLPGALHALLHGAPVVLDGQALLTGTTGVELDLRLSHPLLQAQAHYVYGPGRASIQASRNERASRPARRPPPTVARSSDAAVAVGTLSATLPNLAPWAALAHMSLSGRAVLQGQLTQRDKSQRVELSGGIEVSGGDEQWVQLLGPRTVLSAAVVFSSDRIQLERSQLSGAHFDASAHGEDRDGKLGINWQLALPDLAAFSPQAPGRLSARGQLQGVVPRLALDGSVDAQFLARRSVQGSMSLTLQARDLPQRPSGRIDLHGSLDNAPLRLQASLERGGQGMFTLSIERADWKSVQLAGALHGVNDWLAPQGQLTLRIARVADLDALLGEQLVGSLDTSVAFDAPNGQSRARVVLDARDVGLPSQQLSTLEVRGDIEEPLRQPRLALQLSAAALVRGVHAKLSAQASGPLASLDLRASAVTAAGGSGEDSKTAAGTQSGEAPQSGGSPQSASQLAAAATWYQSRSELKLTSFTVHYRQQSLRLLSPALISFRDGVNIEQLRLELPPAVLQLKGRVTPTLDLHGSIHDLTPALLGVALPQVQAQGHADIELELKGSLSEPSGNITLSAGGLGAVSGAARGLPPGAIKISAQLAGGSAEVNAAIDAGERAQIRVSGRVPLRANLPMALKLNGHMDLDLVNPILEASGQRVVGQLKVEAQVSGTTAAPQARGSLTLAHVELQDYPRGVHLSDMNMILDAEGSQVQLKELSAHAGSGTISATGSLNVSAPGVPVELHFTAHNAQPLKSDLLTADLDMDVHVTGAVLRRELAAVGTLRVNRATITIPNALPPSVAVLRVIRPGQQLTPPSPFKPVIGSLNLTINAPRGIFVRGRGLNAEVGGTVHIGGTGSNPSISGGFDLINGTFDLAGATLNFTSGKLSFNGTGLHHKIDPTLDFTATSYAAGASATLNVGGYADAPVITLSSSPPQPQDQILAELLFGESVSQLSPLQAAGIATALVTLTGTGGGGFNPLNTVQQALGLNRLVISSGTPGTTPTGAPNNTGATVQAGRYINTRIYVGAKQSTNGLTQAQVQVDLTRQWKAQTTLSSGGGTVQGATPENDPGSSVGMTYQFEY